MAFRQHLGKLFNEVKDRVDQYSNEHRAAQQQTEPGGPQPISSVSLPPSYWSLSFDPSTPVSSNFKHQTGDWGWGNNELQNYTPDSKNSFHRADHKLVIRAIADSRGPDHLKYTSARLTSLQALGRQRGCLFAVLTPPCARGIWPAFWLLPSEPFQWPNEGEVDIFESWNADHINHSCLHWGHFNGEDSNKHRALETRIPDMARPEGHLFAFAWDQPDDGRGGQMMWYIGGRPVMKASIPQGTRKMSDWQIIINVAMGGNVCQGIIPADGAYELTVHSLQLCDQPAGGWSQFHSEWNNTVEGHAM